MEDSGVKARAVSWALGGGLDATQRKLIMRGIQESVDDEVATSHSIPKEHVLFQWTYHLAVEFVNETVYTVFRCTRKTKRHVMIDFDMIKRHRVHGTRPARFLNVHDAILLED